LTATPLTCTRPPATAPAASARVLNSRAVQSHRSTRIIVEPNAAGAEEASVVALVVLVADGVVERSDLSGQQTFELAIPIDGVRQMHAERREIDL
jgi:hypothetical protein